jgi:hypothetical protein
MHLMGLAVPEPPAWEPDQGWRVLDPDGHVVNAGGRTLLEATFDLAQMFGIEDPDSVPVIGASRER